MEKNCSMTLHKMSLNVANYLLEDEDVDDVIIYWKKPSHITQSGKSLHSIINNTEFVNPITNNTVQKALKDVSSSSSQQPTPLKLCKISENLLNIQPLMSEVFVPVIVNRPKSFNSLVNKSNSFHECKTPDEPRLTRSNSNKTNVKSTSKVISTPTKLVQSICPATTTNMDNKSDSNILRNMPIAMDLCPAQVSRQLALTKSVDSPFQSLYLPDSRREDYDETEDSHQVDPLKVEVDTPKLYNSDNPCLESVDWINHDIEVKVEMDIGPDGSPETDVVCEADADHNDDGQMWVVFPNTRVLASKHRVRKGRLADSGKCKEKQTFQCSLCPELLETSGALTKHVANHFDLNRFECSICHVKFYNKQSLVYHIRKQHKRVKTQGQKVLNCTICNCMFHSVSTLITHMNNTHEFLDSGYEKGNTESVLDQGTSKELIFTHTTGTPNRTTEFTCVVCKDKFTTQHALTDHIKLHVDEDINEQVKHTRLKRKSLCCICGKMFVSNSNRLLHVRIAHSVGPKIDKSEKCTFCLKWFKNTKTLKYHIDKVHEQKKHICTVCGHVFTVRSSLNKHMQSHEKPTLKCPVCPKLFTCKLYLERHMPTHTGETPFKCSHCPREFTLRWNLIQHERLHTGEKRYKCEKCGKAFTHNVSRKNHMKHHKE